MLATTGQLLEHCPRGLWCYLFVGRIKLAWCLDCLLGTGAASRWLIAAVSAGYRATWHPLDLNLVGVLATYDITDQRGNIQILRLSELLENWLQIGLLDEISQLEVILAARFQVSARILCVTLEVTTPTTRRWNRAVKTLFSHCLLKDHPHGDIQCCWCL